MNETKFAKGPWTAKNTGGIPRIGNPPLIVDDKGGLIATLAGGEIREVSANTHLIAAAPKMYEALEDIASLEAPFKRDPLEFANSVIAKHERVALAALAKARGEA